MTRTLGLMIAVAYVVTANGAPGSQDPLEVCYQQADSATKLACFEHEMQRRHAAAATTQKRTEDNVGLEGKELRQKLKEEGVAADPVKPIVATITRLLPRPYSEYAFELDNGQTWEQLEVKADLYVNAHDSVTIKPGVLGSFYLTTSRGQRIRVHRIR